MARLLFIYVPHPLSLSVLVIMITVFVSCQLLLYILLALGSLETVLDLHIIFCRLRIQRTS